MGIASTHVVPRVPRLRRYPVKTWTWVTRCSGSAHRNGGSPEAFIVLQVYYGRDRPAPPTRPVDSIASRTTTAFSVKTFRVAALVPSRERCGSQVHLSIWEKEKFQIYMTPYPAGIFLSSTHQALRSKKHARMGIVLYRETNDFL